jgi:hypothetical protein
MENVSFSCVHPMGCFIMPHAYYTRLHWHTDWGEQLACGYTPTVICYCGLYRLITLQHSTMHVYWLWIYAEVWSFSLCTFHNISYNYVKHHVPIYAMACVWEYFPRLFKINAFWLVSQECYISHFLTKSLFYLHESLLVAAVALKPSHLCELEMDTVLTQKFM